jgi:transposase-like protein
MQTLLELMETEINERVRQRFNHALETMKDIASMVATPTEAANYATKLEAVPLNGHNKPPSSKPKHIKLQLAREAKKRGVKETAQMHHVSETNLRRWMRGEALGRRGGNRFAKKAAVVVAPAAKRRILPKAAKLAIAGEARKNGMVHITAKKHNVNPYQVRKWMAGKALAAPGGYVV